MLRTLLTLFALTLVSQARADATVSLDWIVAPDPGPIVTSGVGTDRQQVRLRYIVEAGGVSNVTLAVTMPDDVYPAGFTTPPSFTGGSCTLVAAGGGAPAWAPWKWTCSFQAPLIDASSGAISGEIVFEILSRRYGHPHGQPLPFAAVFAGTGVPGGQVSHSESFPASAAANIAIGTAPIYTSVAGVYDTGAGPVPGVFTRQRRNIVNNGRATIEAGATLDVTIAATDFLVDLDLQAGWSLAGGNTATVGAAGGTIAVVNDAPIRSWAQISAAGAVSGVHTQGSATSFIFYTVFIPCSAMGNGRNATNWTLVARGQERQFDGTLVPRSDSEAQIASSFSACGVMPSSAKSSNINEPGPGTPFTWQVDFAPPYGVADIDDPFVVDPIPDGVTLTGAALYTAENRATNLDIFYCDVPALAGQRFDLATFFAFVTTACVASDDGPTAAEINGATHVVAWAPEWQQEVPEPTEWYTTPAPSAPRYFRLVMSFLVDTDTPAGTITNTAFFSTSGPVLDRTVSDPITVDDTAYPRLITGTYTPGNNGAVASYFPGGAISFGVSVRRDNEEGALLRNSKLRVTFPPSVNITGIVPASVTGACAALAATWTLDLVSNPQTAEIDIDPAHDELWNGCATNQAYSGFRFSGTVSTTYPHIQDQPLSATFQHFISNGAANPPAGPDVLSTASAPYTFVVTRTQPVVVNMAAEMRLRLAAACPTDVTGDGAELASDLLAAHGSAGFVYDFVTENSGGRTLTDVSIDITIPKVGAPVGNTLNSNFFGIAAPPSAVVSYCTAPSVCGPSAPGDLSTVTSLRVVFDEAPAYTDTHTLVFLSHAASAPIGTLIETAGTLDAEELNAVNESDYDPFEVGQCRTPLVIEKFFDANGNGTRDSGEPTLAGWTFTATSGGDTQSGTTGSDGRVELMVTPGTWNLSEAIPTGSVTWSSTTWTNGSGVATSALDVGLAVVPVQAVGNVCSCSDNDPCTTDTCLPNGTCQSAGECTPTCGACEVLAGNVCVPNPGVPCADGDNSLCTNGVCNAEGVCAITTVGCQGASVGACSAACDPDTGACTEPILPDECAPPNDGYVFYVALTGAADQLQVRCVLDPNSQAAPVCAVVSGNQCGE